MTLKEEWCKWWWCFGRYFSYPANSILDKSLNDCLDFGINQVNSPNDGYCNVIFNDGSSYIFWDRGQYTSWLNEGTFHFSNGNDYKYRLCRPHAKTIYRFKEALANFNYTHGSKERIEAQLHNSLSEIPIEKNEKL